MAIRDAVPYATPTACAALGGPALAGSAVPRLLLVSRVLIHAVLVAGPGRVPGWQALQPAPQIVPFAPGRRGRARVGRLAIGRQVGPSHTSDCPPGPLPGPPARDRKLIYVNKTCPGGELQARANY